MSRRSFARFRPGWPGAHLHTTVAPTTTARAFGHTQVVRPVWRGNTLDVDTGCAYGGLSAYRNPEGDTVSATRWTNVRGQGRAVPPRWPGRARMAAPAELAEARVAAGVAPVAPPAAKRATAAT